MTLSPFLPFIFSVLLLRYSFKCSSLPIQKIILNRILHGDFKMLKIFKQQPSSILGFYKFKFLCDHWVYSGPEHCVIKCHWSSMNSCSEMMIFRFLKWWPFAILDLKNSKINRQYSFEDQCASLDQLPNFMPIDQSIAKKWPFFDFSRRGCPPSWILKSVKFYLPVRFGWSVCHIKCQSVQLLPKYSMESFQFCKMVAIRHLGFLKLWNFNCQYDSEGQYA